MNSGNVIFLEVVLLGCSEKTNVVYPVMTWIRYANCLIANRETLWSTPRMKNDCEEELVRLIEELNEARRQALMSRIHCNQLTELLNLLFINLVAIIILVMMK